MLLPPCPDPDHEETLGKSKLKGILQNCWPVTSKNVKAMSVKEQLVEWSRLRKTGETAQLNSRHDSEWDTFL